MRLSVRLAAAATALVLLAATSGEAEAQPSLPECRSGTLADYIALGAAGCRSGGVLLYGFRNVSVTMSAPLVGPALTAADVLVDPIAHLRANDPIYQYSGVDFRLARNVPSALGPQSASASFSFSVAGLGSLLYATESVLGRTSGLTNPTGYFNTVSLVGTPGARVMSSWELAGMVSNSVSNNEVTPAWTAAFPRADAAFLLNLSVNSGNRLNPVRIPGQNMLFMVMAPEPSTWALLGTGLLTLGTIAARQRKRTDA